MGLEAASFISELVDTNPVGAVDDYATTDDHLRLIKAVLLSQFPNFTAAAMTSTVAELNKLDGFTGLVADLNVLSGAAAGGLTAAELLFVADVTSAIQAQIDGKAPTAHAHTGAEISALDAGDTTTGIFAAARIPTHTGDVTGPTALTIANDAVTYAKMQNVVADERILGNIAGVGGIVAELTPAQVLTMIGVEAGATADQTAGEIEAIVDHDNLLGVVGDEHLDWTADLGGTNLHANNSANGALALAAGEITQLANIGATVISAADWTAVAALIGINTGNEIAATEALSGVVERATQAEVDAGSDTTRYISPATLAAAPSSVAIIAKQVLESKPTDIVLADDAELVFTGLLANTEYIFEGRLELGVPTTEEMQVAMDLTNAAQFGTWSYQHHGLISNGASQAASLNVNGSVSNLDAEAGTACVMFVKGYIKTHLTLTSALSFQWAQRTSGGVPATVARGSWMKVTKL